VSDPASNETLLVITNLPDRESAERLARAVIEQRAAACVNIMSPCRSLYWWQGKVEDTVEIPVFMKTPAAGYPALEACIRAHHPYDLPEIIAVRVDPGLPEYLRWVADVTGSR